MSSDDPGTNGQYLTFMLNEGVFAIDIRTVREIIPHCDMTKVPLMPDFIHGIINLRGAVVPVVDMQSRFGWPSAVQSKKTCVVIIDAMGELGPTQLGLMVDSVNEVIDVARVNIEPAPQFGAPVRHDLIEGMAKVEGGFIVVLNPDRAVGMDVLTQMIEHQGDTHSTVH